MVFPAACNTVSAWSEYQLLLASSDTVRIFFFWRYVLYWLILINHCMIYVTSFFVSSATLFFFSRMESFRQLLRNVLLSFYHSLAFGSTGETLGD